MKKIGYDYGGTYEYYDIKDYNTCCTCKHFCDNELETRFECWKEMQDDECYESKFDN